MRVEHSLMMEKIEWYQELLRQDPDSRAFFPLAKLLREARQPDRAVGVLRAGLAHASSFLEARLLLIQVLFEQSRKDECRQELSAVTDILEAYPAFWTIWADAASSRNSELGVAIRFLASALNHPEYSLTQILENGLELLQKDPEGNGTRERKISSPDVPHPTKAFSSMPGECGSSLGRPGGHQAEIIQDSSTSYLHGAEGPSEEPTLRTRSMADVLAEQGDISGALEIYQELEAAATSPDEARELHDSVVALASRVSRSGMEPGEQVENGDFPCIGTERQHNVMSLLESLADRLEARARL